MNGYTFKLIVRGTFDVDKTVRIAAVNILVVQAEIYKHNGNVCELLNWQLLCLGKQ